MTKTICSVFIIVILFMLVFMWSELNILEIIVLISFLIIWGFGLLIEIQEDLY